MKTFRLFYSVDITLMVCLRISTIGNDDVGLEEVTEVVVAIQVNSRVRWDPLC